MGVGTLIIIVISAFLAASLIESSIETNDEIYESLFNLDSDTRWGIVILFGVIAGIAGIFTPVEWWWLSDEAKDLAYSEEYGLGRLFVIGVARFLLVAILTSIVFSFFLFLFLGIVINLLGLGLIVLVIGLFIYAGKWLWEH